MKTMKQATFGGKRVLRLFSGVLLAALLLCATCVTAFAAADSASLDFLQEGSITVMLYSDENEAAVTDGTLTLYEVASLVLDNGNMAYAKTGDFAAFEGKLDVDDAALSDALAEYVEENGLTGISAQPDADGSVTFSGLELGLYLVVQTEQSTGYYVIEPFLVTVPMAGENSWIYDVDASPKTEIEPIPENEPENPENPENPNEPEEPENPDESGEDENPEEPVVPTTPGGTSGGGTVGGASTSGTLPQTGQLNWPIPLLAVCGGVLVVLGCVLLKRKQTNAV